MQAGNIIPLLHLTGFLTGAGLYGLILWLSLRHVAGVRRRDSPADGLPLATGVLGLVWNVAAIIALGFEQSGRVAPPVLMALAYGALGFLPAVVIHSVVRRGRGGWIVVAGYVVAAAGAIFQVGALRDPAGGSSALRYTTIAFVALTPLLAVVTRRGRGGRSWWIAAFGIFAASGIHMSGGQVEHYSWSMELIGHHASLPLAFAILVYDFRFAFGDLFLKRALAFAGLMLASGGAAYVLGELPWLRQGGLSVFAVVIGIAIVSAAIWQPLNRASAAFVDRLVLRRPDYDRVRREIAGAITRIDDESEILDVVTAQLRGVLNAQEARWSSEPGSADGVRDTVHHDRKGRVTIHIEPADESGYRIDLTELEPGRRLLSDEYGLLVWTATAVARRLDAVRIIHERCQRDAREQEMSRLATQAELRALRAQVNPHFLFNALNTLGYLIRSSPDRAWETLLLLTDLLRSSLRAVTTFIPLGEELRLVKIYLEIERARFEERLRVTWEIEPSLEQVRIPAFLLQPLVENAIKHGIAQRRGGGEIRISVSREEGRLRLSVEDDGTGASEIAIRRGMRDGVGLRNVRERLRAHYGDAAELSLDSNRLTSRTTARILMPLETDIREAAVR